VAKFLIRQAHGGSSRVVDDGALPFFQNQGYVVIDTLDESGDAPPLYLSKEESDLRYAQVAGISDPATSTGAELRAFFEEKVDRSTATPGQVPVLQADGTMAFDDAGGGSGTVTSVNDVDPIAGDITLTADDIDDGTTKVIMTDDERAQLTLLQTGGIVAVVHDGGTDPVRPPTTMHVLWVVPADNLPTDDGTTAGGAYAAVDDLDFAWKF
jgi:hypothetical protein